MKNGLYLKCFFREYKNNFQTNLSKFSIPLFSLTMVLSFVGAGLISNYLEMKKITEHADKYNFYPVLICFLAFIFYLGYILYKSYPNIFKFDKKILNFEDIERLPSWYTKIGVIGRSSVGKSSFINKFFLKPFAEERTSNINGVLYPIYKPNKCFIDLDGSNDSDLFKFLEKCDSKGIKFALSNVLEHKGRENKILKDWCSKNKFYINNIDFNYYNSNYQVKNKNTVTQEVLITNFK